MGAEEQADSLERGRKDKLPALRVLPKKKSLDETTKVDKVLSKFKTHTITKTNELLYASAVVVTNRLGVKIGKVAKRKEPMSKRRLQIRLKSLGRTKSTRSIER